MSNPRFQGARFDAAADNNPPMKKGEAGEPVRILQQALIDLGIPMPKSTQQYGSPDGVYGNETVTSVKTFQRKNGLKHEADGRVGRNTLAKLRLMVLPPAKPLPPLPGGSVAPPPPLPPEDAIRRLIIRTLEAPSIASVNLVMGGDEINWGWFRLIRNYVEQDRIGVSICPVPSEGDACYNSQDDVFEFRDSRVPLFLTEHNNVKALIVHEAVHAIMDERAQMKRHAHAEAVAYVAQCMYLQAKGITLQTVDSSDPDLSAMLVLANDMAKQYAASSSYRASTRKLDAIYKLIDSSMLYASSPPIVYYNGIP